MRDDYEKVRRIQQLLARVPKNAYRFLDSAVPTPDGHQIPVRIFRPKQITRPGAIVFFHGGGWVTGNIDTYTATCLTMSALTGHQVCAVDYRLAPEHPFPAGLDDCLHVTRMLIADPALVDAESPEDLILVGDSAGGNLAAAVSYSLREEDSPLPGAQILLYPVTQTNHDPHTSPYPSVAEYGTGLRLTAAEVRAYVEMYQPDPDQRSSPLISSLAAPDLRGLPRTLIVTAEFDLLRDEGEAYGHALRAAQTPTRIERIDEALHGFAALPRFFRSLITSYEHINSFLDGVMTDSRDLPHAPQSPTS